MMLNIPIQEYNVSFHLFTFSVIMFWSFLHIDIARIFCVYSYLFLFKLLFYNGVFLLLYLLTQGSPTPRPRISTGPQPVRNGVTQQEVSSG